MTFKSLLLASAVLGATALSANAAVMATQGFADIGTPSVVGGDINTATSFSIGDLVSTSANSGALAGMTTQILGTVTFDTTSGSSLTFGNGVFGTFTSTSISEISNVAGAVAFYVLGNWTPGSFAGGTGSDPASFRISFTQTPEFSGTISDSGTFAVPPSGVIPELSTWAMMGIGFAALGFAGFRSSRKVAFLSA
jgi:hypothetical protein